MIRLDRYLAEMGAGSRQEVKKYIRKGRVTVNEAVMKKPELKVDENKDRVRVDGKEITYVSYEYYMLNKPQGVVSATEDRKEQTVLDLIPSKRRKDLFPVGRLDKDTEGLLLITNDGPLAHRLLSPGKHVDKTYFARVRGRVTEREVELFADRVNIGSDKNPEWTMPAELCVLECGDISQVRLTIHEGKYHQIKRMFQAAGMEVLYLKRERMGTLILDEKLEPGQYRPLTREEIQDVTNENVGEY